MVNLLRSLGLAARFVSGYLIQLVPDMPSLDGPSGPKEDFTDLHAWAEAYLPGAGWVGMDPTSGLLAAEGHLPLACTPSPPSAAPISGGVEPVETEFDFSMKVTRVAEAPRVTRPYSDEAWERLNRLGEAVDERLVKGDVRLTMGGEPTFVSIDDRDGAEWNTGAVGKAKRRLSGEMLRRLWRQFAPGGCLHYGQGKWYPGESLPRWSYTCYWRKDGVPLWRDPEWLGTVEADYGADLKDAKSFLDALTEILRLREAHPLPAHEDTWYYLWKERQLPTNVNPLDSKLDDPEERARLASLFDKGLAEPKGWVLPLQRKKEAPRKEPKLQKQQQQAKAIARGWETGAWALRRGALFLIPGDSPVGLRLPLDGLPWVSADDYPYVNTADPMGIPADEPLEVASVQDYVQASEEAASELPTGLAPELMPQRQKLVQGELDTGTVRTALCVEPREGKLFVFLPPLESAEDYFDLVAAIEATAAAVKMPVVLEGEKPSFDPRIERFSVAPDPGVIEVNVHPAGSWKELRHITETIYEEARLARLSTEKFLIDGRHTGTGGGNHIVVGGATPADSPFLRRPDLLRSLIGYWHHHPSLSFLFSGLFIGPTSQSPRLDEARNDSLYELEIAFKEIDRLQGECPPWMIDRILRHLLTDVTGNTHRAEFCIDKLYSPDSSTGRLGLLELRSFEMPPHARMSLAQQLLMRACIAWFWEKPYRPRSLSRWGTVLHDRFMLPHFVWEDFQEVLADLREAGFAFEEEWFRAHYEFRFPFYGDVFFRDVQVEIRGALEPWHVLGEEGMAGSTVRFVDSSVERLQVKASGLPEDRYLISCNGRRLPLTPTGVRGERVAGVRFRAWQPPSCLHPTIAPDAPLVFDLVDTWSMRAIAGCTYHVSHPGGLNDEEAPINSYAAESRRLARFEARGHRAGALAKLPADERTGEFPCTLDLRRGFGYDGG